MLLQDFEEILDLQGPVLTEVSAVHTIPHQALPVFRPQCPRSDGFRHLGILGSAQLAEVAHHVHVIVKLTDNLQS